MRRLVLGLALAIAVVSAPGARAALVIDTQSVATQTIVSPLFGGGPVVITAYGTQQFTLDLAAGTAFVTSDFRGVDLPDPLNPGGFLNYDLYNTPASTTGTVAVDGMGGYDIVFTLLFELKITSGPLAGQTFETHELATFAALGVPALPFGAGTSFSDPNPLDLRSIYAQTALPGVYAPGDLVGASLGRTVTVLSVVPEPSSVATLGAGLLVLAGYGLRRSRRSPAA